MFSDYFVYYTESTIICLILFSIMLGHDLFRVDRQEKQIKYDRTLVAFMLYCISDELWAAVIAGVLPRTFFTVATTNFLNCIFMAYITYTWLQYVMAVEHTPRRNELLRKWIVALPFIISAAAMLLLYICRPELLISNGAESTMLYSVFLVTVPIIYIVAAMVYALRHARMEKNPIERQNHYYVGFFPLMVVIGGMFQVLVLPNAPVFCFACTILVVFFYIQSMESQISLDPLTGLNNRGQLQRYISQDSSIRREGRRTFVIMLDVNDFKLINDGYGHAEGDRALVIIARSLKKAISTAGMPLFLARYGGDEFILILHPDETQDPEAVIKKIRSCLKAECAAADLPYMITVGIGCAELAEENDTFHECLERADKNLYTDKEFRKRQ